MNNAEYEARRKAPVHLRSYDDVLETNAAHTVTIMKLELALTEANNFIEEMTDVVVSFEQRIEKLQKEKKVIFYEAIALLTQVNGAPMEVAVAHDYMKKLYETE